MSIVRKVGVSLRWSILAKFGSSMISWAVTLIVIRLLAPEDYGLLSMAMVVIGLVNMFGELGLEAAIVQAPDLHTRLLRQAFGLVLLSYLGLTLFVYGTAPVFARFYGESQLTNILLVLGTTVFINAAARIPSALLLREMDFKKIALIELLANAVNSAVTLTLAIFGMAVWSLVFGYLASTVVRVIALNIASPFLYLPLFKFDRMKGLISFGFGIVAQRVLWWLQTSMDQIIIGRLLGAQALGNYAVAMHVASLPKDKISGIINQIAFPSLAQLQSERLRAREYLLKALGLMAFVFLPIFFGISSIAEEAVLLVLGVKWKAAVFPLILLALAMPLRMLMSPIGEAVNAFGRPRRVVEYQLFSILVTATGILIGVRWGIDGVAIGLLVAVPVNAGILYTRTKSVTGIGISDLLWTIRKPLLASVGMYACVWGSKLLIGTHSFRAAAFLGGDTPAAMDYLNLGAYIIVGAISYTGIIYLIDKENCRNIVELVRSMRSESDST